MTVKSLVRKLGECGNYKLLNSQLWLNTPLNRNLLGVNNYYRRCRFLLCNTLLLIDIAMVHARVTLIGVCIEIIWLGGGGPFRGLKYSETCF